MRKNISFVMTLLAFVAMLMVTGATYATVVYDITSDDCSGTGGCGAQNPFGTVTVTTISTGDVQVAVNLLNNNKFVNTGFDGTIDFNLIGNPTISVSALPANWSLVGGPNAAAGSHSMDGLGQFDYAILFCIPHSPGNPCEQGASGQDGSTLTFHVFGTGITEASFADKSQIPPGSQQAFFGIDIISGTTGNTGPVDASNTGHPPQSIPEPSTLLLFGAGLVAVSVFVRSRLAHR